MAQTSSQPLKGSLDPDRKPPHSLGAEMSVLGAMILSKEAIGQVIPILTEDCFFHPAHRMVFKALIELYSQNEPPDVVLLRRQLQRMGVMDDVGGPQFLAQLMSAVPSAANVEYYATTVRDLYMLRKLISACNDTLAEAFSDAYKTKEVLDYIEKRLSDYDKLYFDSYMFKKGNDSHHRTSGFFL